MGFVKVIRFGLGAVVIATLFSSVASAQPIQKPLRWLGEGFSAGYNRCNPGPDVDYYNPWSAHNSMLIHKLPQFQSENFQSYNMSNLGSRSIYRGVPYSVYAAPQRQYNYGHGYGHGMQGVQSTYIQGGSYGGNSYGGSSNSVDSSFEPYDMEEDVDTDADEDEWSETEWDDDAEDDDTDWKDGIDDEDDSARIQAPVPGKSPFSKASFRNANQPSQPANNPELNLFNPFPGN